MTEPYEALGRVYDRWTAPNDYGRWAAFISDQIPIEGAAENSILDLCCGTGILTRRLQDLGYTLTGVDGSRRMLDMARVNTLTNTDLRLANLPDSQLDGTYDSVICTFDSINYMSTFGHLARLFSQVRQVLRPGGKFIFDVNTRTKIEDVFGSSHYGDDLGDFAYVWRNRYDSTSHTIDFLITLFLDDGEGFRRYEEQHRQRWYSEAELREVSISNGFGQFEVYDDYSTLATTISTLRQTWVIS